MRRAASCLLLSLVLLISVPFSASAQTVTFNQNLRQGGYSAQVTALQSILYSLHYLSATPTGYFGPLTLKALKAFQSASGLEPVGSVGPQTRALLNTIKAGGTVTSAPVPVTTPAPAIVPTTTIPAPTLSFTASSVSVTTGERVTLSWSSANTISCTADGGWIGSQPISGSQALSSLTATKNYFLTCVGLDKSTITKTVSVTVTPAPALAPAVTFSVSPTSLASGERAILTWSSANTASCAASGSWSGSKALSGTEAFANLTASQTYTITCLGTDGSSVTKTVSVTVTPAPAPVTPSPQSAGGYPASVVSAGLQSVYDLYSAQLQPNCPSGFKVPGVDALPAGVTQGVNGNTFVDANATNATGNITLNCWDFSGRVVYLHSDTGQTITITNSKFKNASNGMLAVGYANGDNPVPSCNVTVILDHVDIDGTGYAGGNGQMGALAGSSLRITNSRFHNGAKDYFDAIAMNFELDHNYIEGCCQALNNPSQAQGAHGESFHPTKGIINIHDNAWDFSMLQNVNPGITGSGWTAAAVYWESRNAGDHLIGTFRNNIVRGITQANSIYPQIGPIFFQSGGGAGASSHVTYDNNLLEPGVYGYLTLLPPSTNTDTGTNRNYITNAVLSLPVSSGSVLGAAAANVLTRLLARGATGSEVSAVQAALTRLGFLSSGNITGYYGPMTVQAVMDYQKAKGLETTGATGPRTRTALNAALAS